MEDSAVELELAAKLIGVAEISVVGECQFALLVIDLNGLAVCSAVVARGAVARMSDSHGALRELQQIVARKDFVDNAHILARGKHAVVVDDYAAALLTSVLQSVEAVVGEISHGAGLG